MRFTHIVGVFFICLVLGGCVLNLGEPPTEGWLYTSTRDGLVRVSLERAEKEIIPGCAGTLAASDGVLYSLCGDIIYAYDRDGNELRRIPLPEEPRGRNIVGLVALGEAGFALLDNDDDKVYFVGPSGEFLREVSIVNTPDTRWQNMYGVVANGRLIISEDGYNRLMSVDLTTYEVSVFKDLGYLPHWLGALAYRDGVFYLCGPTSVYAFAEDEDPVKIAEVPRGNISGIVMLGDYIYTSSNFAGAIYRTTISTGDTETWVEGLNFPEELVFLPAG